MKQASEVGHHLSEVLLSRQQGLRPVTLVGCSLGAKVIIKCLEELTKRKGCEGLIEDVILLGSPVSANPVYWTNFERVVAGRIINAYCSNDWFLKLVCRSAVTRVSIAGVQPVPLENRRMVNVDITGLIQDHRDYCDRDKIHAVLKWIGIPVKEANNPLCKQLDDTEIRQRPDNTDTESDIQNIDHDFDSKDQKIRRDVDAMEVKTGVIDKNKMAANVKVCTGDKDEGTNKREMESTVCIDDKDAGPNKDEMDDTEYTGDKHAQTNKHKMDGACAGDKDAGTNKHAVDGLCTGDKDVGTNKPEIGGAICTGDKDAGTSKHKMSCDQDHSDNQKITQNKKQSLGSDDVKKEEEENNDGEEVKHDDEDDEGCKIS
ncbi:uncharacterized protein LOC144451604 [Glandiceps talaboti]